MVLTLGFGTGHNAAAQAVSRELERTAGVRVKTVDLLELVPGRFHPFIQSGYGQMLNRFPSFYHYLYDSTSHSRILRTVSKGFIEKMGWTIRKKLKRVLFRFQPTRLVTTHPFSLLLLPPGWRHLPSTGVVTDYELHPLWLARVPRVLCLPPQLLDRSEQDRLRWQTGCRTVETGIPCDVRFGTRIPAEEARFRLGFEPGTPLILVMGGGMGCGPLPKVVEELGHMKVSAQIQVLTGKNHTIYRELCSQNQNVNIRVDRYRNDVSLLMDAADLLVTKPGGLSVTEAMAKGLPLLLFEALPGQEYANQQYLIRRGAALHARPDTVRLLAEHLLTHPGQRRDMAKRLGQLAVPDAARRIAEQCLRMERLHSAL
ncbi:processive 1,2-diacylglycerol beta-glucosyltransferase [Melghirimyces profundicolus]|uniref:Processive 1,2-diacylglycerol beta-glucosyltransferase n=2 Tax=Melghirimyces profundicolus TaxID=1242148 RepID=A0A2T6BC56_9BACL|nr:processive 1,2-diacylglycerol beta-glucosyltransferase [Melghirimyces profundicolus]